MYLAVTGRTKLPRIVNTTKTGLPFFIRPVAVSLSSEVECFISGIIDRIFSLKNISISSTDNPCFRHLPVLPSSQSNPVIFSFMLPNACPFVHTNVNHSSSSIIAEMISSPCCQKSGLLASSPNGLSNSLWRSVPPASSMARYFFSKSGTLPFS